jgi:ATP-dependent exoDNAse (exonuclease V) beta subunit
MNPAGALAAQMTLDLGIHDEHTSPVQPSPPALTDEQEQAVARRRGPLQLSAGAGSGKTSVLVERFVRAVREDGIAPARILAITFTERAAGELRARTRARLLELGERDAARDMEGAPIGTFHGFCARLLRLHAPLAGLDPDFAILDEPDAAQLRLLAFRRALADMLAQERPSGRREELVELLGAYGVDRVRGIVFAVHAQQRSRGMAAPALPVPHARQSPDAGPDAVRADARAIRACALLDEALRGFGRCYAEVKRGRAVLDFDDLELRALALLRERERVRATWRERLELLMVDEFQDTNRRQLELLELLERENLFTVGDELQSIYGFRHADPAIFRARAQALRARGAALVLSQSFRARPPLIAAVNAVFGARFGESHTPLRAARAPAAETEPSIELLLTDRRGWAESSWAPLLVGELPPAPVWRAAEARLLAGRVAELVSAGACAPGEVAVLLRAAGDLPVYERALQERGLRTLAAAGSFWGHQQVGDLLAWLGALANPLDELALYCTLASPLVGISSDGLALLALHARAGTASAWATLRHADGELYRQLSSPDRERLTRFAECFAAERSVAAAHPIAELLLRAIARSGYRRYVLSLDSGERRLANIHKLVRRARRFEASEGRDLRGFLDHVAHREAFAAGAEPEAPTAGTQPDAVRLMTIHAAKGLEFDVVCVADLGRAAGGSSPDLLVDGERVGLRLLALDGSEPRACLEYEALAQERLRAEAAEEERIMYVAMTRARERLLLSGAVDFERWPTPRLGGAPIAWLAPALVDDLRERVRLLEQPIIDLSVVAASAGAPGEPSDGREERVPIRCRLSAPSTAGEVLDLARSPRN